jgi:peptide/nickel transport system permease protein
MVGSNPNSKWNETWRRMKKNRIATIGLAVTVFFLFAAIVLPLFIPYSAAIKQNAKIRLQPPSIEHIFGTDEYGRDEFTRIVYGTRTSLSLGIITTVTSALLGCLLGSIAAFYGGWVDSVIMRIVDLFMCIPAILLALALVAALGPSLINLIIAITVASVPPFTRIVRSVILTVVDQDYIEAARSYGASSGRIILRYVLPNAMGPIIVQTTMSVAGMIIATASLSFIGMGVQPPTPEWGVMLANASTYMLTSPYLLFCPGICIMMSALALNLVGDGLNDALDPRLRD